MSDRSFGKAAAAQPSAALALSDGTPASASRDEQRVARLIRTIEGEIVPRMLMSYSGSLSTAGDVSDLDTVDELTRLLLLRDVGATDIARIIHPSANSLHRTCLDLVAPAARKLSEIWQRDECDFGQVLVALSRLESAIRQVYKDATASRS